MTWFERHLNWSWVIAWVVQFILGSLANLCRDYPNGPVGLAIVLYFTQMATILYASFWVFSNKGRSPLWIFLMPPLSPLWLSNKKRVANPSRERNKEI